MIVKKLFEKEDGAGGGTDGAQVHEGEQHAIKDDQGIEQPDLAKLSSGESGANAEDLKGTTIEGAPGYDPNNAKTQQQLDQERADEGSGNAGGGEGGEGAAGGEGGEGGDGDAAGGEEDATTFSYQQPFEDLKEFFGDDYKAPEGLTKENYLEKLGDEFYKNLDLSKVLDPGIYELHQKLTAAGKEAKFDDVIKEFASDRTLSTDNPRGFLEDHYAKEYDVSPEDAKSEVDKLSDVQAKIQTKQILTERKAAIEVGRKAVEVKRLADNKIKYDQQQGERTRQIESSLTEFKKLDKIFGVPVSEAEKQEFAKEFEQMVTPDPKTGVVPVIALLQSNEMLAQVAFLLKKGGAFNQKAFTKAKEITKQKILKNIDAHPRSSNSGGDGDQGGDTDKIDLNALSAPEALSFKPNS